MVVPCGNGDNICKERKVSLAVIVISPGHHRSVRAQGQAVSPASRNRNHVGRRRGHIGFPIPIAAPCNDGTIVLQGEAVERASSDGHHIRGCWRHIGLPIPVLSPCGDCAVRIDGQTVKRPGGDCKWIHDRIWDFRLTVKIIAPETKAAYLENRRFTRHAAPAI